MSLCWLVVTHGELETKEEADRLQQLRDAVGPVWFRTVGNNDRTAFCLDSGKLAGQPDVLDMIVKVLADAPRHWEWAVRRSR